MFSDLSDSQRPEHTTSAHITKNCVFVIIIGVWEKCPKISMSQKNILKFWQKGIMSQMYEIDSNFHLDIKHNSILIFYK
jgi:hypothetical protein